MPRYLVQITVELPAEMDEADRAELLTRERERGRELRDAGVIEDMWRLPGQLANIGIWRATDAGELDRAIASLPVWRWTRVEVTALADHYLTARPEGGEDG